jgi:hypothetical protein
LRKPPPPADLDAFVAEATTKASDIRELAPVKAPPAEMIVKTDAGRELREVTVYLPVDLARQMSLRCVEKDRDASNLVADALAAHLAEPAPAPKTATAPAARKTKTTAAGSLATWSKSIATLFRQRLFAV